MVLMCHHITLHVPEKGVWVTENNPNIPQAAGELAIIFGGVVVFLLNLNGLILICAGLLAAAVTFAANWLALIPWRRSKTKHWSEQARVVYPALAAARSNLWTIPSIFMLTVVLLWPGSSSLWLFTGIISVLGAYAGTFPMDQEVFPRTHPHEWMRQAALGILFRFLIWIVFIGAAVSMPDKFNGLAWGIGGMVIGLSVIWSRGGLIWLGRKLGLCLPEAGAAQKSQGGFFARMAVPFREVLLMRSPQAQAAAFPKTRQLLFTERALALLSDDEVAAVCAHELAHLTESKPAQYSQFCAHGEKACRRSGYLPMKFPSCSTQIRANASFNKNYQVVLSRTSLGLPMRQAVAVKKGSSCHRGNQPGNL